MRCSPRLRCCSPDLEHPMNTLQRSIRRLLLAAMVCWPLLHLALSRTGAFSSWRFAGWGMYATPYPSPRQHPIDLLVQCDGPSPNAASLRSLRVLSGEGDLTQTLAVIHGLHFVTTCKEPDLKALHLPGHHTLERLVSLAQRVRQLDRNRELEALARLVMEELLPAPARYSLRLRVGDLYAKPLSNSYGIKYQVFSYVKELQKEPPAPSRRRG